MTQASTEERIWRLLSPGRRERLDVTRILSMVPLRPYMHIADIGCGPGFFTIPFAKFLWDGKVYAIDVDDEMLEALKKRAEQVRMGNIVAIKAEDEKLPLEDESLDGALMACVLHEVVEKSTFIVQAASALRKGGWCAVIEWRKDSQGEEGPPQERRISEDEVVEWGRAAGLRTSLRRELNDVYYMIVMTK